MDIDWQIGRYPLVALLLGSTLLGCGTEPVDVEPSPSCESGDVVLEGSIEGESLDRVLRLERGTLSSAGGAPETLEGYGRTFAHRGGVFLDVHGTEAAIGDGGAARARVVYREHPDAPFVVANDARLIPANEVMHVGFEASSIRGLPGCGDLAGASGLVAELCAGDCVDDFVLADDAGKRVALDVHTTSGAVEGPFTVFALEGGGVGTYEVDATGGLHGFVMLPDLGPDPLALYCVSGAVSAADDGSERATFETMQRAGTFEEATPARGELAGGPCE